MRYVMMFTSLLLLAATTYEARGADLPIDRVENGTLYFKAGSPQGTIPKPIKTGLHDLKVLGSISDEHASYLVATARPCLDCPMDTAVYLIRTEGGKLHPFVFPGKVLDPKNGRLLLHARAFFGRCMKGEGEAYVVHQKETVDRKKHMQTSLFIAKPGRDFLQERMIERRVPPVESILRMVKSKQCFEIAGRNRTALKKPLDLNPRVNPDEDDDDDNNNEDTADGADSPKKVGTEHIE